MRDEDKRTVRNQIDEQISTKMYEQHLPNLSRLSDEEIEPVMSFYRRMKSIQKSHQTYNQMEEADSPSDKEGQREQSRSQFFSSYSVGLGSKKALNDLEKAKEAREEMSFLSYLLSGLGLS
ncbi:hypothetical protein EXE51_15795 [Halorubrum sp. CGM5_25_10-8B]|uniref:hypothetical protein n=1 Tax=Halorubrum sp. CGM5_25_10-8B TaxID=2518115 RepID=UPI0010F474C3|nr:hypothetical protein [Halorubrum sp. CGM5_25_10-8B]TKX35136.1 hypothetical protein EXE51_15795 [Halorubrum sp. CGM5_25_10-8B]